MLNSSDTKLTPLLPGSSEEESLEQRIWDFLHNQEDVRIPKEAEDMIKELWGEFVLRESWYWELFQPKLEFRPVELTEEDKKNRVLRFDMLIKPR